MPQVGGQYRQHGIEIGPLAIPPGQAMHREGMAQVMKPGTAPPPPVRNPTSPEKLSESAVDGQTVVRSAVGAREEGDIRRPGAQGVSIATKALAEGRRHRNEAILAVLPLANDQDSRQQVDLAHTQGHHLADARAAPIEDADDGGQDTMPQGRTGIGRDGIRRFQEPPDLVVPEDVRNERGRLPGRESGLRDIDWTTLSAEEDSQASNQADPCPLGPGTLIRILRDPTLDQRPG